jgi:hypothetical protein
VWQTRFLALPILSFPLCYANAIFAAILTLHVGEAWQIKQIFLVTRQIPAA